jgi:pimeloyl-ACP methyl ester carboxylesterase
MAVHTEVAGGGPAVVLIHAGICDSRMWDPQWEALAREHRVLRLDLRGFGRSPLEPGELCHGADVLAAMDRAEMPSAALVAASMGGDVTLQVALHAPERVRAMALIDPALDIGEFSDEVQASWTREEAALEAGDLDVAVEENVRFWVDGPGRPAGSAPADVRALVAQMQRRAFELQLPVDDEVEHRELVDDVPARLGELTMPALVLDGEHDTADFRAIAQRLRSELPRAQGATIAGAAHLPSMERPEAVDALLLPFLLEHA